MAKEPKICPYCHLEISKDQETTTTQSNLLYHKACYENVDIDSMVANIQKKYPTPDGKLARIISQNNVLIESAQKQEGHLSTVKSVLVLFMILVIIGIVLQSCSALL